MTSGGKTRPTTATASLNDRLAGSGGHPMPEAVLLGALTYVGLKGALHDGPETRSISGREQPRVGVEQLVRRAQRRCYVAHPQGPET